MYVCVESTDVYICEWSLLLLNRPRQPGYDYGRSKWSLACACN